jgi:Rieske Fe-S protein
LTVEPNRDQQNSPGPSLWPIGFAIGVACALVGLVLSLPVFAVGAAIAIVAGALWVRDSTRGYATPVEHEPEQRPAAHAAVPADTGVSAQPVEDDDVQRVSRSVFLEGATLGLGVVIGGVVSVPALGFMVAPAFVKQHPKNVDIGPLSDFPEGKFVIATFLRDPSQGEVTRRTAYIRNNGVSDGAPSFTIISNRCAHLGCPVQANGPVFDKQKKVRNTGGGEQVTIIPMQPAGFGCPCHGGQYDIEGNRTAGPPVRALDRYDYEIRNGQLVLLGMYSVSHVDGAGAAAKIHKYTLTGPGQHVDGPEWLLYPWQPPH